MRIYIKNVKKKKLFIDYSIKLSLFVPDGLEELIEKIVPEDNFILGVGYDEGDYQICISGHPKTKETIIEGTLRELQEELSLVTNHLQFSKIKGKNHFFYCNISDTQMVPVSQNIYAKDITPRSVVCIFGDENKILKYLSEVVYEIESCDRIDKIWAASKKDILNSIKFKNSWLYCKEPNFSPKKE